jgi:hypothetical protein
LLRDVVEDDDGVGDIVVVLVALVREEEEEEDGLEFSIFHTIHTRPPTTTHKMGEKNVSLFFFFPFSLCRQRLGPEKKRVHFYGDELLSLSLSLSLSRLR